VERIEPIRRPEESPWVAPTGGVTGVARRAPGEEQPRKRRQPPREPEPAPDGHPDADGHVDVSV
jgi:hypothetical protein